MDEKINILITNGHLKVGGVEKSLITLLNSINYETYNVDLLLFEDFGEYYDQIPNNVNVKLFDLKPYYGSVFKVIKKCLKRRDFVGIFIKCILTLSSKISLKYLKFFKLLNITKKYYDVAIAYRVEMSTDFISFAVKAPKKYMWWHHGEFDYDQSTVSRWNVALKNIDKIVSVSESAKEMICPYFKNEIVVIPNMLDIQDIYSKSKKFNPYEGISEKIIVSVGRMSPEKKMINAVYAMENLLNKGYSNVKWYLVGDGAERNFIESEIRKHNLENYIICVGNQKNPYPYIQYSDFFVHLSYVESQGLTVLEAMLLEKCGVVTRSTGVEEYVKNGENSVICEQNVDDLTNKIEYVLKNPNVLNNMKKAQVNTATSYSPEAIVKKFDTLMFEGND